MLEDINKPLSRRKALKLASSSGVALTGLATLSRGVSARHNEVKIDRGKNQKEVAKIRDTCKNRGPIGNCTEYTYNNSVAELTMGVGRFDENSDTSTTPVITWGWGVDHGEGNRGGEDESDYWLDELTVDFYPWYEDDGMVKSGSVETYLDTGDGTSASQAIVNIIDWALEYAGIDLIPDDAFKTPDPTVPRIQNGHGVSVTFEAPNSGSAASGAMMLEWDAAEAGSVNFTAFASGTIAQRYDYGRGFRTDYYDIYTQVQDEITTTE